MMNYRTTLELVNEFRELDSNSDGLLQPGEIDDSLILDDTVLEILQENVKTKDNTALEILENSLGTNFA